MVASRCCRCRRAGWSEVGLDRCADAGIIDNHPSRQPHLHGLHAHGQYWKLISPGLRRLRAEPARHTRSDVQKQCARNAHAYAVTTVYSTRLGKQPHRALPAVLYVAP